MDSTGPAGCPGSAQAGEGSCKMDLKESIVSSLFLAALLRVAGGADFNPVPCTGNGLREQPADIGAGVGHRLQ